MYEKELEIIKQVARRHLNVVGDVGGVIKFGDGSLEPFYIPHPPSPSGMRREGGLQGAEGMLLAWSTSKYKDLISHTLWYGPSARGHIKVWGYIPWPRKGKSYTPLGNTSDRDLPDLIDALECIIPTLKEELREEDTSFILKEFIR